MLTVLPVDGVVEVVAHRARVHDSDQQQVHSHTEVCDRQVTDEELGHGNTEPAISTHNFYFFKQTPIFKNDGYEVRDSVINEWGVILLQTKAYYSL